MNAGYRRRRVLVPAGNVGGPRLGRRSSTPGIWSGLLDRRRVVVFR
jgi:hypothetical protein